MGAWTRAGVGEEGEEVVASVDDAKGKVVQAMTLVLPMLGAGQLVQAVQTPPLGLVTSR